MAARQKEWARKRRELLIRLCGGCCVKCGSQEQLTFDCITPQGQGHHKLDTSHRMSFYFREFHLNNIQLLCHSCNAVKGITIIDFRPDNLKIANPNPF
jgi:5-methylcytosine-specific restriction endonuclease McrA